MWAAVGFALPAILLTVFSGGSLVSRRSRGVRARPGGQGWHQVAPPARGSVRAALAPARASHTAGLGLTALLRVHSGRGHTIHKVDNLQGHSSKSLFWLLLFLFVLLFEVYP